jgi:hypothetical protein
MVPRRNEADSRDRQSRVDAVAWFAALVHARHRADFSLAAEARIELRRLGVLVEFNPGTHEQPRATR